MAQEHGAVADFGGFGEAGLAHIFEDAGVRVPFQMFGGMNFVAEGAVRMAVRAGEIEEVERTAGFEDAADFAERGNAIVGGKMMEHERGKHAIKGRIGVGEFVGEALIELDAHIGAQRFSLAAGEGFGIGIEADDSHFGVETLDADGESAGAGANIENAIGGAKLGLLEQAAARFVASEQFNEGIVKRQGPIAAGGGEICSFGGLHRFVSSYHKIREWCARILRR